MIVMPRKASSKVDTRVGLMSPSYSLLIKDGQVGSISGGGEVCKKAG
jgi:hypothetical protein